MGVTSIAPALSVPQHTRKQTKQNKMNIKVTQKQPKQNRGFTLLEFVIVIAILAVIGGAALVSYDGLDTKAAKSQATFNLAAIDKGLRLFKVVSGDYPESLDLLTSPATTGGSSARDGQRREGRAAC
jgi:prepilin-type N-terminal cleavage/methylation domain-containing protein